MRRILTTGALLAALTGVSALSAACFVGNDFPDEPAADGGLPDTGGYISENPFFYDADIDADTTDADTTDAAADAAAEDASE